MQSSAGGADPLGEQILDGSLAIFVFQGDLPFTGGVIFAYGRQCSANGLEIARGQESGPPEHFGMRDGGADVVAHQAIVQEVIVARGVLEHLRIECGPFVPEPGHGGERQVMESQVMVVKARS
jgi:hypothetical protein